MTLSRLVGTLAACALLVTACASRPSEEELTEAILTATNADPNVDITADQATCIAGQLLGSDLSDTTLSGLAEDFDNPEVLQTEVDDIEPLVTAAAETCN